jgi:(p)ppGpp synthase/HD superfamily hydrolase
MNYEQALKIATDVHKGQKRWNGDDHISVSMKIADLLHAIGKSIQNGD